VTDTGKPGTAGDEPSSKALAQQLGKLAAPVILVILAALVEHYCSYKAPPFGPGAKIVSIDGDSLRAGDGSEYRIFGIDAPELHQTCKEANGKAWACGRAAKARLTTLIKGGNVACEAKGKDRYGRTVAVCSAEGVADLGEAMVRQGYTIDLGGEAGIPITTRKPQRRPPMPASDAGPSTGRQTGAKPTPATRIEAPPRLGRLGFAPHPNLGHRFDEGLGAFDFGGELLPGARGVEVRDFDLGARGPQRQLPAALRMFTALAGICSHVP